MSRLSNFSDINETFIVEPIGAIPSLTACTSVYTDVIIGCSGNTQIFMGSGIITFDGNIYTDDNITASTINASTFYSGGTNIIDIIKDSVVSITGGTFNDITDTLTLVNNGGNTINVTGFTDYYTTGTTLIGKTVYFDRNDMLSAYTLDLNSFSTTDTFSTGLTFSNNQIIIARNDGVNLSTFVNTFTGLTINGTLGVTNILANTISGNTISATTFYGDGSNLTGISTQDTSISEFSYSDNTFTITDSTGGTFSALFDTVSGLTVNGILSATTISADTYYNLPKDIFVTGGTYSNGTTEFSNNTGGTFSVFGFYTGATDVFVTGATKSNNVATFVNNTGGTFTLTGLTDTMFTGGTISGATNFTNGLTANTFSLSTTPNTNTTNTNLLTLNQSTGVIEQRSINSLTNVVNLVTVGLSGSTGVDYNSVKLAVDSITGASATNTFVVKVGPGVFYENPITMKSYVDVIGESETNTIIQANNPNVSLIIGADQSMINGVQIQGCTGTGVAAVIYSSATTPQLNAIFYVENVRFGTNYTHAKTVGTGGGNCIMQCSNVKYGGYPFTIGFYVTNDGSGIGRMQLRNVTSTNGGVATTTGLIFAKADKPSCAFIVNGCLLTKATGAAAGVGFWVEDGGSLRLTAVNFQRWETAIYAPQTGSAPSIEAIALNFENCTTDVNIIHSGATGKIQGTDNYVKTLININAPLYEVNQDPRIISVAKKGGDFSSIKTAVDSITGSSINNRFLVSVGPGRFSEPLIDLTGKPYVSVQGSNIITTEVVPSTNTQHIFKIGQNNEISFLSLSGAPTGYAGIYAYDIGDYGQAHKLSFNDCDTNVWVESNTQDTIFFGEYLDFNGSYSYGTKVIANNGYEASAKMENYYNFPTGTETTIGNSVQGSGATLSVFVGDGVSNGATGSTNYEVFDYGSLNTTTTTSDGWDYSVRNPNIGGPARFDIDSISVINSMTYDVSIEHPNTFGTFNGSASHVKINTLSNDVYWAFLDIDDGEFDVTRKISVTFQDGTHTDATTLIFEGGTMGLIDGGVITYVSGLTVNISAGFGYLEKTVGFEIHARIDWDNTQITLSPDSENYLFFNENNILSSSGSLPDSTTNIILGRVVTNATGLRFIDVTPYNAKHTSNLLSTFNRNALGPIYSIGSTVTENAIPYHLNISAGDYYYSENNFKPSGGTDVNFIQYYILIFNYKTNFFILKNEFKL
jgi:pectin methylesterase-like acyl-CoA thioesterase